MILVKGSADKLLKCGKGGLVFFVKFPVAGCGRNICGSDLKDHIEKVLISFFKLFYREFIGTSALRAQFNSVPG